MPKPNFSQTPFFQKIFLANRIRIRAILQSLLSLPNLPHPFHGNARIFQFIQKIIHDVVISTTPTICEYHFKSHIFVWSSPQLLPKYKPALP